MIHFQPMTKHEGYMAKLEREYQEWLAADLERDLARQRYRDSRKREIMLWIAVLGLAAIAGLVVGWLKP